MRARILALLTGLAAVVLAVLLLLYFDPFGGLFDRVFQKPEEEQPSFSDVSVECVWRSSDGMEPYAEPKYMIDKYFTCFYSASGDKSFDGERIMESLFADSAQDCIYDLAAMKSGAVRLETAGTDLSYDSINVNLWAKNVVEINKDGVIIMAAQSAEPQYNAISGIASGEGVYLHTFIFERFSGSWMITSHSCDGGAWGYARRAMKLLCGGGDYPSYNDLYDKYPLFAGGVRKNVKGIAALTSAEGYSSSLPTVDIPYNRAAAVEYAERWTSVNAEMRNTELWQDYEQDSGNFMSQCIYAGIGRMDATGSYIWKWFDPKVDPVNQYKGCSRSWTEGESFWRYCTDNDRTGLCTVTDAAGGQMEPGDVVQLMMGSKVMSQAVVTQVVTDTKGRTVELLVSGHDNDLVNYPLSAVHCDWVRMIKVIGFNNS